MTNNRKQRILEKLAAGLDTMPKIWKALGLSDEAIKARKAEAVLRTPIRHPAPQPSPRYPGRGSANPHQLHQHGDHPLPAIRRIINKKIR